MVISFFSYREFGFSVQPNCVFKFKNKEQIFITNLIVYLNPKSKNKFLSDKNLILIDDFDFKTLFSNLNDRSNLFLFWLKSKIQLDYSTTSDCERSKITCPTRDNYARRGRKNHLPELASDRITGWAGERSRDGWIGSWRRRGKRAERTKNIKITD